MTELEEKMPPSDPHAIVLNMIKKVKDPQLRAVLGYMTGMIKAIDMKLERALRIKEGEKLV